MSRRRIIKIILPADLESLSTRQLLARLKALWQCEDSFALSDRGFVSEADGIVFKDSQEWQSAFEDLKAILAIREHVPRRTEREALRKERAKHKRNQ